MKQSSVKEIRIELFKLQRKLHKIKVKNKLVNQYKRKVAYMLMWMRMIPVKSSTLRGWHMPDHATIYKMTKEAKDEPKGAE